MAYVARTNDSHSFVLNKLSWDSSDAIASGLSSKIHNHRTRLHSSNHLGQRFTIRLHHMF
jgi:hypothetical protein